ncbi:hypothetical protein A9K55_003086 [Cordyceps militaris]|uniref:2EXR domain-containing protein n=1 Tax=Cordyceps militaris TaxID=73501 RepID=A0A2H4S626_CORMI|nr:hypothetical protein A9K55_003086 [Cordyceps militaris]
MKTARTRHTRATVVDSDDSQSESDSSEAGAHGFFDDEALEAEETTDEDSGSDEEDIDPFPFTRLPPELRLQVWTLFCTDLRGAPRVLSFNVSDSLSPTRTSPCKVIGPGHFLEDQTRALRHVLATNQQSRAIAKQRFPDELHVESDNGQEMTICFNRNVDVALLDVVPDFNAGGAMFGSSSAPKVSFDGFSQSIINLALPLRNPSFLRDDADVTSWLRKFTSLQRIFLYVMDDESDGARLKEEAVRWCASPHARQYYMETFRSESVGGEDYTQLICWADAEKSPSFTKAHVPNWHTRILSEGPKMNFEAAGVMTYPMVIFDTIASFQRFDEFVATDNLPLKVQGANDEDSEDSDADIYEDDSDGDFQVNGASELVDAYESDGIDDDEPEIFDESDEEHLDDGDSDEGDGGGGGDDVPSNPFSSPEPSEDERGPSVRGRQRRVIADSDDEDDSEPSTRPVKRKRVHVVEDSDEELSPAEAAEPQLISSDEDEGPITKRRRIEIVDSDEGSEDGSEEDDDQPQQSSLADRLQNRSRYVRAALSGEEDSEEEGNADGGSNADEEDDEEENEEEEDDEEEDGLVDNMAAESDDDEEDEEDEEDE